MNRTFDGVVFFRKAFEALTGRKPFPWQERAFVILADGNVPATVSLPTGTGKTSLIPIWLTALAWQAGRRHLALPRRLVWIVNRRVVVDQATDEAVGMVERVNNLNTVQDGEHRKVLAQLRNSLASLSFLGGRGSASVVVSTLRGQLADSGEWKLDPTRPAIVIGTMDMIGSRLLFSGYGDGKSKRPLHAGLLGQDSWVVLDEAHLTPAFADLLQGIQASQAGFEQLAPFRISFLSATQRGGGDGTIRIEPSDEAHKVTVLRNVFRGTSAAASLKLEALLFEQLLRKTAKRARSWGVLLRDLGKSDDYRRARERAGADLSVTLLASTDNMMGGSRTRTLLNGRREAGELVGQFIESINLLVAGPGVDPAIDALCLLFRGTRAPGASLRWGKPD